MSAAVGEHRTRVGLILAAGIIGIGIIQFMVGYIPNLFSRTHHKSNTVLRVKFGTSLTIALELMLAADILETAVAPTWEDIGKLAAIAVLRTSLNYFLERELRMNQQEKDGDRGRRP